MDTIKKGLLVGTIESVWLLSGFSFLKWLSLNIPQAKLRALTGLLGLVILFVGILYGLKKTRDNSVNADFTYLKSLKTGMIISVVVALMVSLFSLVYVTLINPDFSVDMMREAEASLKLSGASPSEIEQQVGNIKAEYSTLRLTTAPLIVQPIAGTVFSLILSIFFRSKRIH